MSLTSVKRIARTSAAVLNRLIAPLGLRLMWRENVVLDLRDKVSNPIEAEYLAGPRPYVIGVDPEHCRILTATALPCAAGNPFVDTLRSYAEGRCRSYPGSPLQRFYDTWQPRSAAEALGLEGGDARAFADSPPLAFTLPWSPLGIAASLARWDEVIAADNREHGLRGDKELGWKSWGPVDPSIGELEFARLTGVYESIREHGYRRNDDIGGDISGVVLHDGGGHRVLVAAGHHRAAALTALGEQRIAVRIYDSVVRRSEVAAWPNVRSGLFSEKQALELFDRMFAGLPPPAFRLPD